MIEKALTLAEVIIRALTGSPTTLALLLVAAGIIYLVRLLITNTKITEALANRVQMTHIDGIDSIKADVKTVLERQSSVITRLDALEDASTKQATDLGTALQEIESLKQQTCGKASTCLNRALKEA